VEGANLYILIGVLVLLVALIAIKVIWKNR
jgi:hypothetical protein